ncbi:MAG: sulfite exporter TauE/SafE family protein [Verrucomicrobiota bacterium]
MFDHQTVYNGYTALIAGLVTSVHCVGMCGPLSCAFAPSKPSDASPQLILTSYHLSKLLSYGVIGLLAGAFGGLVVRAVGESWLNYLPWVLVVFFLAVGFRLDRHLPKPKWLGNAYARITRRFGRTRKPVTAAVIGLATPLLPCGPLYMIFGLAMFSGSALRGAEFAVGFGLGTLPLLWLAQSQFMRLNGRLNSAWLSRIQRTVAVVAALVVAWRLRTTLGIEGAEDWVCHPF